MFYYQFKSCDQNDNMTKNSDFQLWKVVIKMTMKLEIDFLKILWSKWQYDKMTKISDFQLWKVVIKMTMKLEIEFLKILWSKWQWYQKCICKKLWSKWQKVEFFCKVFIILILWQNDNEVINAFNICRSWL